MAENNGISHRPRVIAIIGGGFSGTVLAVDLLRHLRPSPTRIVLVERNATIGDGVAYARHGFPYLLNVPIGRMPAVSEDAGQLLGFVQRHLPGATGDSFIPRRLYGEYLRGVLEAAQQAAPPGVRLDLLRGESTAVHSLSAKGPSIVSVGTRQLLADEVVLACGDPARVCKPYAADLVGDAAYVSDPYADEGRQASDRALLIIGTGLAMADVAVAAAEGNPSLNIVALSRHGLLPRCQKPGLPTVPPTSLKLGGLVGLPLRALVRAVRELARGVHDQGGDWREVIAGIREIAPRLWQGLGDADRRRFLRHVRVYWDVHRHRMPPATAERLMQLQRSGRLRILAGCVTQLCTAGAGIVALWRPRGRYDTQELWVDRVVECSGPDQRLQHSSDTLWKQLLSDGMATADRAGLGICTGENGALIDIHGRVSSRLFYVGPMLRAAYWEATAAAELRQHVRALALALAAIPQLRVARHNYMHNSAGHLTRLSRDGH